MSLDISLAHLILMIVSGVKADTVMLLLIVVETQQAMAHAPPVTRIHTFQTQELS